jgi:radical SAM protein with 4Fe4S-binding SPASM domain
MRVFLCLGFECNLNCPYCIQGESKPKERGQKTGINPDIYPFIKGLLKNLPPKKHLRIIFFGGEPLLYLDKIKTITKKLKNKRILFQIITNGKLLDEENIKFFNRYNFGVQISWDGSISATTRGYNALKDKISLINKIKNASLSAVLNSKLRLKHLVLQMQGIDNYYFKNTGRRIQNNIATLNDTSGDFRFSKDFNFEVLRQDFAAFIDDFFIKKLYPSFTNFFKTMLDCANFFYVQNNGNYIGSLPYCGEGFHALSLSIDGSILRCHNSAVKTGTIYEPFWTYLNRALGQMIICKKTDCSVYGMCRGGCKLQKEAQLIEGSYCLFQKALYEPMIEFIGKIGDSKEEIICC